MKKVWIDKMGCLIRSDKVCLLCPWSIHPDRQGYFCNDKCAHFDIEVNNTVTCYGKCIAELVEPPANEGPW